MKACGQNDTKLDTRHVDGASLSVDLRRKDFGLKRRGPGGKRLSRMAEAYLWGEEVLPLD